MMEQEFQEIEDRNDWNSHFQGMRDESTFNQHTTKDARKKDNRDLNRYRDVIPYDHSRILLRRGSEDYINANLICVKEAGRQYILTQGPLPTTIGHFWLMIWEQKSKGILMLNGLVERGYVKCHQYWPEREGEELKFDVELKVKLESEEHREHYIIRKCLLTDEQSGQSRQVIQFHYTSWPDFGLPQSRSSFLEYLIAVRDSGSLDISQDVGPPVVHCSAGIGRSGTFCLVDSCLLLIEKHKSSAKVNVKNILLEMRTCRMGLIQTPEQLRFSYQAIIEGTKSLELENNSISTSHSESSSTVTDNLIGESNEVKLRKSREENGANKSVKNEATVVNNNLKLADIREQERQERKRKTLETIDRIKKTKKEHEDRSRLQSKLIRWACLGLVSVVGVGFVYSSIVSYL